MPTLIPALNGTVIDPAGNTYVTLAEADAYFQKRANGAAWALKGQPERESALLTVIEFLDPLNWIGGLIQETQPLAWPREAIRPIERRNRRRIRTGQETLTGATAGLYDKKQRFWPVTAIPTPVKNAQCELAFALLIEEFNFEGEDEVKSFSDDDTAVTFDKPRKRGDLPLMAVRPLGPLLMHGVETGRG